MATPALTDPRAAPVPLAAGRAELFRALGVLAEPPGPAQARLVDLLELPRPTGSDWTEAFVVQLVPHASIYVGADGMLGGPAADRVAGFWRALRLAVPADPDHLTALLGLYAALLDAESAESDGPRRVLRRQARAALLHEHLLSWLLPYLHAMSDGGPPAYDGWARMLREALLAETAEVGAAERLPLHLRDLPPMPTFDEGPDAILTGLLTPARSGLLLTRARLVAMARQAGLGLRLGDRRRALRALIEQEPEATLVELAAHARTWATRHHHDEPATGPAARHWADRATAAAHLLTVEAARLTAAGASVGLEERR